MKTIDASFDLNGASLSEWMESVVDPLSHGDLEALTVNAILAHRRHTDVAEEAYEDCSAARQQLGYESTSLQERYLDLMKRHYELIEIVEALTNRLGYIPKMPP